LTVRDHAAAGANAFRSSSHWLLKNDWDTSAFGTMPSKP